MNNENLEISGFDFENAEMIGEFKLSEIYESKDKMKVGCNTNGKYYLIVEPRYSGLETAKCAYATSADGRKPSLSKDCLKIYQNQAAEGTNEEFACMFGKAYEGGLD